MLLRKQLDWINYMTKHIITVSLAYFRLEKFYLAKRDAEKAVNINKTYKRARNLLNKIRESLP